MGEGCEIGEKVLRTTRRGVKTKSSHKPGVLKICILSEKMEKKNLAKKGAMKSYLLQP